MFDLDLDESVECLMKRVKIILYTDLTYLLCCISVDIWLAPCYKYAVSVIIELDAIDLVVIDGDLSAIEKYSCHVVYVFLFNQIRARANMMHAGSFGLGSSSSRHRSKNVHPTQVSSSSV